MKIFLLTLGCAKNQVDSERLAGMLEASGFELVEDVKQAEIGLVNTCGFIVPAVEESLDAVFDLEHLKKSGSLKKIGVIGCLVNRYGEALKRELPSVDYWAGADEAEKVVEAIGGAPKDAGTVLLPGCSSWSRYLKIAEGCDNRCSYCTIPSIRGGLKSRSEGDILRDARRLVESGAREVCLVGQDLTAWGMDRYKRPALAELLQRLEEALQGRDIWIRLLYLHPSRVTRDLVETIAKSTLILNYLDIPVQHVDGKILKAMNRGHVSEDEIRKPFEWARSADSDFALRTTIITGFPGETEKQFLKLVDFLEATELDRVGVFPYSEEEGTPAVLLSPSVPAEVRQKRAEEILEVQEEISWKRQRRFVGRRLRVLVEGIGGGAEGSAWGRSFRDAPEVDGIVEIRNGFRCKPGTFVKVDITESYEHDLEGEVVHDEA
ncbi:MAG: 30S ribosomal protein S12 methylthiotransferase RimO [Thermovirgaceae bacterium]